MGAEEITAKECFFLFNPSKHRIGPVQEWRGDKLQRLSANVQGIPVLGNLQLEIGAVGNVLQIDGSTL